jgi:hypothetical protein
MSTESQVRPKWVAPEAELGTATPNALGPDAALTDAAEERRLVRKVDWILLPVLLSVVGTYILALHNSLRESSGSVSSENAVGTQKADDSDHLSLLTQPLDGTTGLQYYDKAVLGSAAIFGILKDLHLTTTHTDPTTGKAVVSTLRYSTASSAF